MPAQETCPKVLIATVLAATALLSGIALAEEAEQFNGNDRSVAITFDDLPHAQAGAIQAGKRLSAQAIRQTNMRILGALQAQKAPAIGFVIEQELKAAEPYGQEILKAWTAAGYSLGNHLFSHADTNELDAEGIEREILKGERTIRPLLHSAGQELRFIRFPYNHTGDSEAKRDSIAALTARHGYTVAAATIDTSDYVFDRAYEKALANKDTAQRILAAYLDHTRAQIDWYGQLDRKVLGYEPPAIMLLHLNRLNADAMEHVLTIFRQRGYRFVTLADAQADPAYRDPLSFVTQYGPMWGYRWAKERGVEAEGRLEKEPPEWIANY